MPSSEEQDWERQRDAGQPEGHVPQQRSGQEELRAAHREELERLAAEVGHADMVGKVQAYVEHTADEVLQGITANVELLERATWDPRSEVARDTVAQDVELPTGERFRIMVQRLR
jgi:hypothetical protein